MLIPGKSHSRVESRNSQVSIETLNLARVRTYYRRDRSRITGGGAKEEGREAIAGQPKMPGPPSANDRSTAGGGALETSQNDRGSVIRKAQWSIGHRSMGRGITTASHLRRTPLDNRLTSRTDGRAKWQAAARSPTPRCARRNTGWERNAGCDCRPAPGYGRPQACRRTWPDNRPTSQAAAHLMSALTWL